jgi:hypothetical protein
VIATVPTFLALKFFGLLRAPTLDAEKLAAFGVTVSDADTVG